MTYQDWLTESKQRFELASAGFERAGTLQDVAQGKIENGFLYVEANNRGMLPLANVRHDWWVVTGRGLSQMSWCCTPDTPVFVRA